MLGTSGKSTIGTSLSIFDGTQVCAQVDPELFFPETPMESVVNMRSIKPICNACQLREPCLEYAINDYTLDGIWAGTTLKERNAIRRKRKASV